MNRRAPIVLLLLVVGLGVLGTVVVRALRGGVRMSPSAAQVHTDFARVLAAVERYRADGKPLPEESGLDFLVPDYLPELPLDPWGRPYHFLSNGKEVFLSTFGQDGGRGGNGEDQDHTNHDGHPTPAPTGR